MTVPNLTGLVVLLDGNDVTILNYEEDGDLYLVADERTPEGWLVPGADFDRSPADEALRRVADDIDVLSRAAMTPWFRVGEPMSGD
jgi:hypothetical protein